MLSKRETPTNVTRRLGVLRERLEGPGNAGSLLKYPRLRQSFRQQQGIGDERRYRCVGGKPCEVISACMPPTFSRSKGANQTRCGAVGLRISGNAIVIGTL